MKFKSFIIAALIVFGTTAQSFAQSAPAVAPVASTQMTGVSDITYPPAPDATKIPALRPFVMDRPGKAYYMGRVDGLDGWFIMLPESRVQIAYTTLNGYNLVIGAIFSSEGKNVTEHQVVSTREREGEVNKLFVNTVEEAKNKMAKSTGIDRILKNLNPESAGDRMFMEFTTMFHVQVGERDAPLLYMVIDPNCPHCKRAWAEIAKLQPKLKMQVRIVPVGILGGDSKRMSAVLLDSKDPLALWNQYAAKDYDKTVLAGEPSEDAKAKEDLNRTIFDRWKLNATPFFAYRSKSGSVKVLNQVPNDIKVMLEDIAPLPPSDK